MPEKNWVVELKLENDKMKLDKDKLYVVGERQNDAREWQNSVGERQNGARDWQNIVEERQNCFKGREDEGVGEW